MKNIIFIAPPASGKGTQSNFLVSKYGYHHISTGDLLRDEVDKGTPLGKSLEDIMKSGAFVSDEIVTELLKNKLKSLDSSFILDGYPRNIKQAHILDDLLKEIGKNIDLVIYLDLDISCALDRVLGRMVCPKCGRSYHKSVESLKPLNEGVCDDCKCDLIHREDDNEETFKTRFETYVEATEPLLNYYEDLGILNKVDASGNAEEAFKSIEGIIND